MNCAQVKERLVDFLYGEMSPETQKSFSEHLAGCASCKTEVASYEQTLGHARAAICGPLLEEPPARVHLAAIEAAKAAVKQRAAKVATLRDDSGFFARLWRTPWLLPAFGAASIATAVFLVRVLKNPEVMPGQRPHAIDERALATPEPAPAPERAPRAPTDEQAAAPAAFRRAKADSQFDDAKTFGSASGSMGKRGGKSGSGQGKPADALAKSKRNVMNDPLAGVNMGEGHAGAGAPSRFAEPPPPRPATKKSAKDLDDLLSEVGNKDSLQRRAQPPLPAAEGKAARAGSDEERLDGLSGANVAAKPTARSITHSASAPAGVAPPANTEPRPAPASAYAPAPVAAPAQRMRDYPAESAASASAPSAAPAGPAQIHSKKKMVEAESATDESAKLESDSTQGAEKKAARSSDKYGPSVEERLRKADRLYASQEWLAAAEAYRDLLRRFPDHKDAPKWRERLSTATLAEEKAQQAKTKKASKTIDTLDRPMK